ncbi:hypothetical protein [Bradyrhizobium icense]|uniref:hypothetical protein n=1 Tax=Bradyrhizobium icense TaxID=1274631 RepID=UPI001AEC8402|nr:hypothetical protein [Bradyrhizobium icense]
MKLKPIRVENGDGQELTVCHKCNGKGAVISREEGRTTCPDCKGAGMRRVEDQ